MAGALCCDDLAWGDVVSGEERKDVLVEEGAGGAISRDGVVDDKERHADAVYLAQL